MIPVWSCQQASPRRTKGSGCAAGSYSETTRSLLRACARAALDIPVGTGPKIEDPGWGLPGSGCEGSPHTDQREGRIDVIGLTLAAFKILSRPAHYLTCHMLWSHHAGCQQLCSGDLRPLRGRLGCWMMGDSFLSIPGALVPQQSSLSQKLLSYLSLSIRNAGLEPEQVHRWVSLCCLPREASLSDVSFTRRWACLNQRLFVKVLGFFF